MSKYRKETMIDLLNNQVSEIVKTKGKKITRSRIGIALLILEGKSLTDIEIVYGYKLDKHLGDEE